MARRLKKLIKEFVFEERNRSRITLEGLRLNPCCHHLEIEGERYPLQGGPWPTDTELKAKTWLTNPKSVKQWLSFESVHTEPEGTSIGFRLSTDGVDELFFDGGTWRTAVAGEWNTEAEVANSIATLPVTSQSLQVVVNLATTDTSVTPILKKLKVLFDSDIEELEDILVRSLVSSIREKVRPIAELGIQSDGTVSVPFQPKTKYENTEIDSVYNLTTDPNRLADLFVSEAGGIITLSSAPTLNDVILVRFTYEPVVNIAQGQDFVELSKVPAVILDDIRSFASKKIAKGESVLNKSTNSAWQLDEGEQRSLEIMIRLVTGKELDLKRLTDAVNEYFEQTELLRLKATDEDVRMVVATSFNDGNFPNQVGVHTARIRVQILDAVFYPRPAIQKSGVKRLIVGGDLSILIP